MMGEHNLYCEADTEFWKELQNREEYDTWVAKRISSPYPDELWWVLDGKMSTKGLIPSRILWHFGSNHLRAPRLYNKMKGYRALDICSSYGVSAREFCARHSLVDVIEFEYFQAQIVKRNLKDWGYGDKVSVRHTNDLTNIDYTAYDSVRFGLKEIEHLFWNKPLELMKVPTLCFEFDTNPIIVETLYKEGYRKGSKYTSCDVFTKHK